MFKDIHCVHCFFYRLFLLINAIGFYLGHFDVDDDSDDEDDDINLIN